MKTDHAFDLTRCSHGLDLGWTCWSCTTEGLKAVREDVETRRAFEGREDAVASWIDCSEQCHEN
jgi:hypothetical protein